MRVVFGILMFCGLIHGQQRMVSHVTAPGGGFETTVLIENTGPEDETIILQPYLSTGVALSLKQVLIEQGSILELSIEALFGQTDVSHFSIQEGDHCRVTVSYRKLGPGSPAHVAESSLQRTEWRLFAGDWDLVFDGLAVVNLGSQATDVQVIHTALNGDILQTFTVIENLEVNAKGLYVLGGPQGTEFSSAPTDSYFTVKASQPLAITALRGTPPGASIGYLWENEVDASTTPAELRLIPHITQQGGGFSSKIVVENKSNNSQSFQLQPFQANGTTLNAYQGQVPAMTTLVLSPEDLFGDQASNLSHFAIQNTSEDVFFSVQYETTVGPGSPALVRESTHASDRWLLFPGNWDEVFDGVAAVNMGDLPTDVYFQQIDHSGVVLDSRMVASSLPPLAKMLYVLGGPQGTSFEGNGDYVYRLVSSQNLAVTALRGTIPGAPSGYLWKNAAQDSAWHDPDSEEAWPACPSTDLAQIQGYLYQNNDALLWVAQPGVAPEGATPVQGASISLAYQFHWENQGDPVTSTLEDGSFSFADLIPEFCHLEATWNQMSLTQAVTLYPGGDVTMGTRFTLDRNQAFAQVQSMIPTTSLVAGSLQPLQAGTLIADSFETPFAEGSFYETSSDTWFFMEDPLPTGAFAHQVNYYFVDAQTGNVTSLQNVWGHPLINHQRFWDSENQLFTYDSDLTLVDLDHPFPDEIQAQPIDEVIQFPEQAGKAPSIAPQIFRKAAGDDVFVIVVNGALSLFAKKAGLDVYNHFKDMGVPTLNMAYVRTSSRKFNEARTFYNKRFDRIQAKIEEKLAEGKKPTFILYLVGHHEIDEDTKKFKRRFIAEFKTYKDGEYRSRQMSAKAFRVHQSKACKVRVILEMCSAIEFGGDMDKLIRAVPASDRPDHAIYCSTYYDEPSHAIPAWAPIPGWGSVFTNEVLKNLTLSGGDISGLLKQDGTLIDDLKELTLFYPLKAAMHPVVLSGTNTPNRCTSSQVSVTESPATGVSRTCDDQLVGTIKVQNQSDQAVKVETTTTNDSTWIKELGDILINPGEEKTFHHILQGDPDNETSHSFDDEIKVNIQDEEGTSHSQVIEKHFEPGVNFSTFFILSVLNQNLTYFVILQRLVYTQILVETLHSAGFFGFPFCNTDINQYGALHSDIANLDALGKGASGFMAIPGLGEGLLLSGKKQISNKDESYIMVFYSVRENLNLEDPTWYYQYGFVFDADNDPQNNYVPSASYPYDFYRDTDLWYSAEYDPATGWDLKVTDARNNNFVEVDTAARVYLWNNTLVLVAPQSEFRTQNPRYRVTAFTHKGDYGLNPPHEWSGDTQPRVDEPLAEIQSE